MGVCWPPPARTQMSPELDRPRTNNFQPGGAASMLQVMPTCGAMHGDAARRLMMFCSASALAAVGCFDSPLRKTSTDRNESPDVGVPEIGPAHVSSQKLSPCGGRNDTGVWRTTSKEVIIREFEYFRGGFRFRADC